MATKPAINASRGRQSLLLAREREHFAASRRLTRSLEKLGPETYRIPAGYVRALEVAQAQLAIAYAAYHATKDQP